MYLFNTDRLLISFLLIVTSEQSSESTANPLGPSLPLCHVQDVLCVVNKCIESRRTGASSTLIKKCSRIRQIKWGGGLLQGLRMSVFQQTFYSAWIRCSYTFLQQIWIKKKKKGKTHCTVVSTLQNVAHRWLTYHHAEAYKC